MDFKDFDIYQKVTNKSAIYPNAGDNLIYPVLGLGGESGEVSEKVKKLVRDNNSNLTDLARIEIAKELGDVIWYVSQISTELGMRLSDIIKMNIEKINSRHARNKVHGSGDNR